MDKKIFKNTLYQMAGKVATSLLGVISFGLIAHYLKDQQFGEYALISSFVGFVMVFADLGLGTLLTRELSAKRASINYISSIFTLRAAAALLMAITASILIFFFPYSSAVKSGVIIFSLANIASLLAAIIWAIFQAELRFDKIVISQIVSSVTACLLILTAVLLNLPLLYFIAALSVGIILSWFVSIFLYKRLIPLYFNKDIYLNILKDTWPLGAGVILSVIYFKIDSLILPYYFNPSIHPDLGYYSMAYKVFEVALVFGGYYTQTLFPVFSSYLKTADFQKFFRRHLIYTLTISAAGAAILFVFARIFILGLGGETFIPSIPIVQILSFAVFATILSGFFLNIGIAGGKQLMVLKFSVLIAILNIALNFYLIPIYSITAAAWITVFTQFVNLVINFYVALIVFKKKKVKI